MKKAFFAVLLAVTMPASATPIAGAIAATSGANSSRQNHTTPAGVYANERFSEVGYLFCPRSHGRGCKPQIDSFPLRYGNPEPWIKWMKRHAGSDAVFMGLQYNHYRGEAVLYYGKEPTND